MPKFIVEGICFVPHEITIEVEAKNAEHAVKKALKQDWCAFIDQNSGDYRAAFDWEPYAREIIEKNTNK